MPKERIIVVDDEKSMRDFLEIMLKKEGYEVRTFDSGAAALDHFRTRRADVVITDLKMPGMSGVELLKGLKELDPQVLVIMITAYASVDNAIEAMKSGAYDYFTKPFNVDEIKLLIDKALRYRDLEKENRLLKKDLKERFGFASMVGTSPRMKDVYSLITSVAPTKTNVFITGESGTGKELAARAIHYESPRRDKPFVAVNCGAIPENLLESELFGHQKGAFTGAAANKPGLAEMADGGTLFLDEVTELPLHLQVKLLRFIQERVVRRVGGTEDIAVDIRVISASNRDPAREVAEGRFRQDLYYRLNVITVNMPPLRERREDIPLLARHFVDKYARELDKAVTGISEEALELLSRHDYAGNVRELENIIERAVALETGGSVTAASLPPSLREEGAARGRAVPGRASAAPGAAIEIPPGGIDLEKIVSDFEKTIVMEALEKAGGVKKKAAELLGLSFRAMRYKLSKYEDKGH
ncbi:MAG TPA: sigma-54-dependent Fis family transcriptional regulator [Deltaproteobacteria bacterium]|nr:sigma-54-dependent Fis family transcriptional regulator [Deltaproteobacteria bacterium]